mgnify:CR=1 FL=1
MKPLKALILSGAAVAAVSCITVDGDVGKDLIDSSLLFDTYTVEFPLEEIQMKKSDELSGYSTYRLTLGAIRDDVFGLTTRSCAISLVPALDTLDLGKDPVPVKFQLHFACDTVSLSDPAEAHILQNVYVYSLLDTLSVVNTNAGMDIPHGTELITKGLPIMNGTDSLSMEFTDAFARKYISAIQEIGGADHVLVSRDYGDDDDWDDDTVTESRYKDLMAKIPGIYMESEVPTGTGGRINMFELSCLSVYSQYYYRNNNVATLTVNSEYDGVRKDTTFLLIPGEPDMYDETAYTDNDTAFPQLAFNRTTHESTPGIATGQILMEGGCGLKPVISALEIQRKTLEQIALMGGKPENTIINKASIILPFDMPEDYTDLDRYPALVSTTIRITDSTTGRVAFASLTDASASTENQGDIDRANLQYAPDITFHVQEFLTDDLTGKDDRDVWLLNVHSETIEIASGNQTSAYLQNLAYASYYQNLYGGGMYGMGSMYGSSMYGGGYYNNYYNYSLMMQYAAAMQSSSSNQTQTITELDKDNYYRGILNGPSSGSSRKPVFRITFSIPKG